MNFLSVNAGNVISKCVFNCNALLCGAREQSEVFEWSKPIKTPWGEYTVCEQEEQENYNDDKKVLVQVKDKLLGKIEEIGKIFEKNNTTKKHNNLLFKKNNIANKHYSEFKTYVDTVGEIQQRLNKIKLFVGKVQIENDPKEIHKGITMIEDKKILKSFEKIENVDPLLDMQENRVYYLPVFFQGTDVLNKDSLKAKMDVADDNGQIGGDVAKKKSGNIIQLNQDSGNNEDLEEDFQTEYDKYQVQSIEFNGRQDGKADIKAYTKLMTEQILNSCKKQIMLTFPVFTEFAKLLGKTVGVQKMNVVFKSGTISAINNSYYYIYGTNCISFVLGDYTIFSHNKIDNVFIAAVENVLKSVDAQVVGGSAFTQSDEKSYYKDPLLVLKAPKGESEIDLGTSPVTLKNCTCEALDLSGIWNKLKELGDEDQEAAKKQINDKIKKDQFYHVIDVNEQAPEYLSLVDFSNYCYDATTLHNLPSVKDSEGFHMMYYDYGEGSDEAYKTSELHNIINEELKIAELSSLITGNLLQFDYLVPYKMFENEKNTFGKGTSEDTIAEYKQFFAVKVQAYSKAYDNETEKPPESLNFAYQYLEN